MATIILCLPTKSAVELGVDQRVPLTIDATTDAADRALIARHLRRGDTLEALSWADRITDVTPSGVAAALRSYVEEREAWEQAEAARLAAEVAEIARQILARDPAMVIERRCGLHAGRHEASYIERSLRYFAPREQSAEVREAAKMWAAELQSEADSARATAQAEVDRLHAADLEVKRQAAEAERAERLAWAEAHGSVRLRRLLAEKIDCDAVYFDERMALERPGWVQTPANEGRDEDPRNVPLDVLDLLAEARQTEPDAVLRWVSVYRRAETDAEADIADRDGDVMVRRYQVRADYLGRTIEYRPDAMVETVDGLDSD